MGWRGKIHRRDKGNRVEGGNPQKGQRLWGGGGRSKEGTKVMGWRGEIHRRDKGNGMEGEDPQKGQR